MLLATGSTLKALTQESRCAGRVSSIQATLSTLSGVDTWCGSTVMLRKPPAVGMPSQSGVPSAVNGNVCCTAGHILVFAKVYVSVVSQSCSTLQVEDNSLPQAAYGTAEARCRPCCHVATRRIAAGQTGSRCT